MMYSTPIQTAAFRSALMPGFPGAAAIVRFVFILFSPAAQGHCGHLRLSAGRGSRITTAVSEDRNGRVGIDVVPNVVPSGPQARALVAHGGARPDLAWPVDQVDDGVGMCLEVEPPAPARRLPSRSWPG